jgi:hypothetical protein
VWKVIAQTGKLIVILEGGSTIMSLKQPRKAFLVPSLGQHLQLSVFEFSHAVDKAAAH